MLSAGSVIPARDAELWRNRSFQWLFATHVVGIVGNQFSLVALPWLALNLTGSPAVLAATVTSMAIPQVLLILLGGATADRFSPLVILTTTNCANACTLAILAITTASDQLHIHLLLALTTLLGTSAAFAVPAASSLLPRIVTPNLIARGNAALMISRHIAMLIGPITAGALIAWASSAGRDLPSVQSWDATGISYALAIDAAALLVAACSIQFIRMPPSTQCASMPIIRSVAEGLSWLWNDRPLRTLLFYYAAMMLLMTGPTQVGIPVLVDGQLGHGAAGFGLLLTATSIGSISGMTIAALRFNRPLATLGTIILAVDIIGGAALIALSHAESMIMAATLCALMGLGGGYVQLGVITWIQQRIPSDMLGRAMSVITLVLLSAAPLSAAVTGVLLTQLTISSILAACGSMLVLIASLCLSSPTLRSIDPPPLSHDLAGEAGAAVENLVDKHNRIRQNDPP